MNIEDLIKLSDVMIEHSLGPNGGEISFWPLLNLQVEIDVIQHYICLKFGKDFTLLTLHDCGFLILFMLHTCYCHPGLVYCMDYLEKNIDWLESKLEPFLKGQSLVFCVLYSIIHSINYRFQNGMLIENSCFYT